MVELVKDGRFVVLRHQRSEGRRQYYRGLHQWNFDIESGEFIIRRPGRQRVQMNRVLEGAATADCFMEDNGWLVCLITKRTELKAAGLRE
jgi:hypothetical protein